MAKVTPESFGELDLLQALMQRVRGEAGRRSATPSQIIKRITNDSRLWIEMERRLEYLSAIATGAKPPEFEEKTRSVSLEMRDRIRSALATMEAETLTKSAA